MKKILGFGIYGTGLVAPFHAKAIRGANGARLVGFCGRNQERREALANEYGGETFAQVEAMVACPDLDVLVVATPNHLHTDAVMAGIAAGKHVLVEKPPAMKPTACSMPPTAPASASAASCSRASGAPSAR